MKQDLHEEIIFSSDIRLMNSSALYDCILHIIGNRGTVTFKYNGSPFRLAKDEIAIISRPRLVSDIVVDEDFSCHYIAAPDKYLNSLLPANNYSITGGVKLFENPVMKVNLDEAAKFRRDISNIRDRLDDIGHKFYHELLGSLLQTMIYDLFDFHLRLNNQLIMTDRVSFIVKQFFTMLEAGQPRTHRDVAYYADVLSVTPKYLSDAVKRLSGSSASTHINRVSTAIIVNYLQESSLSLTQIADEMNFTSVSYFSRYCSKQLGMSPSLYRALGKAK